MRDVLTLVEVERTFRVAEDAEETNDAEREQDDAADEQELLGMVCRREVRKKEARWFTAGLFA